MAPKSSPTLPPYAELLQKTASRKSLLQFIPFLNSHYQSPRHLHPLVVELERAWAEPVRATACAPPRHGKTETVLAFIAQTLLRQPHRTLAYVTYAAHLAQSKSRKVRDLAEKLGVRLAPGARRTSEWRTVEGGGLLATGIGGPLTGQGVDILLVDDPYKNRTQAESAAYRQMVTDWWGDVAESRIEPGGSALIFHTRWTTDDLIAHVLASDASRWRHHHLPALSDAGAPLWPERWSFAALEEKRKAVGDYTWASLYQGEPRPRGGKLFHDTRYYDRPPASGYRVVIGLDLAYSARKQADYSVALVLAEKDGLYYVLDVQRLQVSASEFVKVLQALQAAYPAARLHWHASSLEHAVYELLRKLGSPRIELHETRDEKYTRALPASVAWNTGKILVPPKVPWLKDFSREVESFTGFRDKHDDQVDALATAYVVLSGVPLTLPKPQEPISPRRMAL